MLPPGAIFKLKIHQNAYAAGASSRTPLGEITELPRPFSWFSGSRFAAWEGRGKGGKRKRRKREGDSVPPLLFIVI